ncbi:MAG TPA: hypothetical protein PLJ34_02845, partial [Hyphomicrobiales bacterium]|nr:hypothetical protein [Hyphomicrobiales bacterium]
FDLETAATFFRAMLGNGLRPEQVSAEAWAFLALAAVACFAFGFEKIAANEKGSGWLARNVVAGGLLALALIFLDRSDTFIYFRF